MSAVPVIAQRSPSFRSRSIFLMVCLIVLLGGGLVTRHLIQSAQQRAVERSLLNDSAKEYTQIGVLQGNEGARWVDLMESTKRSGSISDADLSWVLARLGDSTTSRKSQSGLRGDLMQDILGQVTFTSPEQRDRVFQATAAQLRQESGDGIGLQQAGAMSQFRRLKDARAISLVVPYLADKRPNMRLSAIRTLKALGYKDLTPEQLAELAKTMPRKLPTRLTPQ